MTDEAPPPKPPTDWERIENDYRVGILTLREIAGKNGITEGAIRKRAKRDGWERDLTAKVRAKATALVRRDEVRNAVRNAVRNEGNIPERVLVDEAGRFAADVELRQRKDVRLLRDQVMTQAEELRLQSGNLEAITQLVELVNNGESDGPGITEKMQGTLMAVLSLPGRTKTLKDLAESLQKLITLERTVYRMEDNPPPPPPVEPAAGPGIVIPIGNAQAVYLDMIHRKA